MLDALERGRKVVAAAALVLFSILLVAPLSGCAYSYSAGSIEGRVVDAETEQPLEGVIVVANWALEFGWEGGSLATLYLTEAQTDANGRYFIPAWGPKKVPGKLPSEARLKNDDPALYFYLNGYEYHVVTNSRSIKEMGKKGPAVRSSEWNGRTIRLRRFAGTPEEYRKRVLALWQGNVFLRPDTMVECEWKRVPTLIRTFKKSHGIELVADHAALRRSGLDPYPPETNPCEGESEFIREMLK